jgi:regulator of protease activity HflC (stomatin/prohibitin superfamily)
MRKVRIRKDEAGLVFDRNGYQRFLEEGAYWMWPSEKVYVYDRTKPFWPHVELNILLRDEALASELYVIDVKEGEIVLQYVNGLLQAVLTPGRYACWKGVMSYEFVRADTSKIAITEAIDRATLTGKLLEPFVRTYVVESYEKALLFVDGVYVEVLEAGVYYWWKNAVTIRVGKVDTRQQQTDITGQEILTRDKAMLRINAYAQYRVVSIEQAMIRNKDYERQLYVSFQFALREFVSTLTFDELLDRKESLAPFVLQAVAAQAAELGVEVTGFGIKDIILPGDVKEIMNQVLVAEKKAQANIIMRREETASTRSLLNTAKLMEDNQMLFKLKEMEYVEKIAEKINSISVSGNGVLIDQLRQIFVPQK